jgi:CO/xanthine dehydrogenase FAD-binding subunit
LPLKDFYKGVRKTVMEPDEMMVDISFPAMNPRPRDVHQAGLRRAQAISIVDVAVILDVEADTVKAASITLGAVAPTIIHAPKRKTTSPANR